MLVYKSICASLSATEHVCCPSFLSDKSAWLNLYIFGST